MEELNITICGAPTGNLTIAKKQYVCFIANHMNAL